jgi:lipopolysaccharide/colanic/teichoic acid biosynthesis glycosyltransferase
MAKRLFDMIVATIGLLLATPWIVVAAVGVRLSSAGPAFYRARRVGRDRNPFTLYKLRTMHLGSGSKITAAGDARVFRWGAALRRSKIDELPQLWNVLRGDMSIVGPRPEDFDIVETAYGPMGRQTLRVRPGLAGVSSLYNYTHGERLLDERLLDERLLDEGRGDAERNYVERLLPIKLALETVYLQRMSLAGDVRLIARTVSTLAWSLMGRTEFPDPPEMEAAKALLHPHPRESAA